MSAQQLSSQQFSHERLMNILLAPQISEKATYVTEKKWASHFSCGD